MPNQDQLDAASGSLLRKYFVGATVDFCSTRSPLVFPVVVEHLSEYPVFPLGDAEVQASGLGREKFLRYLLGDAKEFGLTALIEQTAREIAFHDVGVSMPPKVSAEAVVAHDKAAHDLQLLQLKHSHEISLALLQNQRPYDELARYACSAWRSPTSASFSKVTPENRRCVHGYRF